jgi:patatin-like phospholipase/acyl hydrolase
MGTTKKLLSIDGGGIRGIVPATFLTELERRTGSHTSSLFDVITGTSTGGILALALTCPGPDGGPRFAARELVELYRDRGPEIFPHEFLGKGKQLFGPKYAASNLERILREYFGDTRLREAVTPVSVTAYAIEKRDPFFFRSWRAKERDSRLFDYPMWVAARATSAAPTYFAPFEATNAAGGRYALVDGGLFANNPSIWAVVDLLQAGEVTPTGTPLDEILVVSLATAAKETKHEFKFRDARGWGLINWVRPVIDIALTANSDATEYALDRLLPKRSFRFKPDRPKASEEMDDARAENIGKLEKQAHYMLEQCSADIDRLCRLLIGPSAHE